MGVTHGKKTHHDLSYPHPAYGKALSAPVTRRAQTKGHGSGGRDGAQWAQRDRDRSLELDRDRGSPSLSLSPSLPLTPSLSLPLTPSLSPSLSPSPSARSSELGPAPEALIQPRKLVNPVKGSRSHQALHRELLLSSHRRPEEKPELQRVLEQRRRKLQSRQRHEETRSRATSSPLQQELLKRQQRLDMLERELEKQRDQLTNEPEFIRVKDSLRRTTSLV